MKGIQDDGRLRQLTDNGQIHRPMGLKMDLQHKQIKEKIIRTLLKRQHIFQIIRYEKSQ